MVIDDSHPVRVVVQVGPGQPGPVAGLIGIGLDRVFQRADRAGQRSGAEFPNPAVPAQQHLVQRQFRRRLVLRLLLDGQRNHAPISGQGRDDSLRGLVHRFEGPPAAAVAFHPEVTGGPRIEEPHGDAQIAAARTHAAVQHKADVELPAQRVQDAAGPGRAHLRPGPQHAVVRVPGQVQRQSLGQQLGQRPAIPTPAGKRQDGDRQVVVRPRGRHFAERITRGGVNSALESHATGITEDGRVLACRDLDADPLGNAGPLVVLRQQPPQAAGRDADDRVGLGVEPRRPGQRPYGDRVLLDVLLPPGEGLFDHEPQEITHLG